jgi:hypothetical protein
MRNAHAASLVVLLFIVGGCASGSAGTGSAASEADSRTPGVRLVQTSEVPQAAAFADGPLSVHYALQVENRAAEPITLRQVTLQSVSQGAYFVAPTSKPFDLTIGPAQKQEVEMWVSARPGGSVVGANGPVTLRVTCTFEGANGKFQQIVMQRVNERTGIDGVR